MKNWILSQIATGSPYGVCFEEEGAGGGGEGGEGAEGRAGPLRTKLARSKVPKMYKRGLEKAEDRKVEVPSRITR